MSYLNISYYKSHRTKLLKLMHPENEKISIGRIHFKEPYYTGVIAKLWKDEIRINFDESLIKKYPKISEQATEKLNHLNHLIKFQTNSTSIFITPLNKNKFEDTKIGMEQRATLYVLILDICLKAIFYKNESN